VEVPIAFFPHMSESSGWERLLEISISPNILMFLSFLVGEMKMELYMLHPILTGIEILSSVSQPSKEDL